MFVFTELPPLAFCPHPVLQSQDTGLHWAAPVRSEFAGMHGDAVQALQTIGDELPLRALLGLSISYQDDNVCRRDDLIQTKLGFMLTVMLLIGVGLSSGWAAGRYSWCPPRGDEPVPSRFKS